MKTGSAGLADQGVRATNSASFSTTTTSQRPPTSRTASR